MRPFTALGLDFAAHGRPDRTHTAPVVAVACSPTLLVTGDASGALRVRSMPQARGLGVGPSIRSGHAVNAVAIVGPAAFVVGGQDGALRRFAARDVPSGVDSAAQQTAAAWHGTTRAAVTAVARQAVYDDDDADADPDFVASASADGSYAVWAAADLELVVLVLCDAEPLLSIAWR